MLKINLEPAIVLHTRAFKETSLIVDLFSKDHGRFSVVAKGAKRPKSSQRGLLQPFCPLLVSAQGAGELLTLTHAESSVAPIPLQGSRLAMGFYINEIMIKLLIPFDPHPELYLAFEQALFDLKHLPNPEVVLRIFEKELLEAIGYGLSYCEHGDDERPLEPDIYYNYEPVSGLFVEAIRVDDQAYIGQHLLDLKDEKFSKDMLLTCKRLMRVVITHRLAGRKIHSRRMVNTTKDDD